MKCRSLFSGKNKKLTSAEFAQSGEGYSVEYDGSRHHSNFFSQRK